MAPAVATEPQAFSPRCPGLSPFTRTSNTLGRYPVHGRRTAPRWPNLPTPIPACAAPHDDPNVAASWGRPRQSRGAVTGNRCAPGTCDRLGFNPTPEGKRPSYPGRPRDRGNHRPCWRRPDPTELPNGASRNCSATTQCVLVARVNGELVDLASTLTDGDVVEPVTAQDPRAWRCFVTLRPCTRPSSPADQPGRQTGNRTADQGRVSRLRRGAPFTPRIWRTWKSGWWRSSSPGSDSAGGPDRG